MTTTLTKKDYKSHLVRRVEGASTMTDTAYSQIQLKIGDNAQHTATADDASMNTGIIVNGGSSGGALINASTGMRTTNTISF